MRFAYAMAFDIGPGDFYLRNFTPSPEFSSQLDLRHQADSRWALPQISSCQKYLFAAFKSVVNSVNSIVLTIHSGALFV